MNLRYAALFLMAWLTGWSACAQVKVSVDLDQQQFLPGETIPIKVRIINHSGQTLHLGEDDQWLHVTVLSEGSFVIEQAGDMPVKGAFDLPTAKMATKEVNISPYFGLNRPGRYSVVATVEIKDWNQRVTSTPAEFDIIHGTKLWEKAFGVPHSVLPDGSPEVRKYLLQQANHLRSQIVLYVRITDASENRTLKVVPIGPMVSFSDPKAMLDKDSSLHVLYQAGPRVFTYFAITPDGKVLAHEKVEYSAARPRLSAAEDGSVGVSGGYVTPAPPPAGSPSLDTRTQEDDEG